MFPLPQVQDLIIWLVVTILLAGITALLGRAALRRVHVTMAVITSVALTVTIYRAEVLGRLLVIPPLIKWVHLTFANIAFVAFLVVVATGLRLLRLEQARRRLWHRRAVIVFLVGTVVATVTGSWMLLRSQPRVREGEGRASGAPRRPAATAPLVVRFVGGGSPCAA